MDSKPERDRLHASYVRGLRIWQVLAAVLVVVCIISATALFTIIKFRPSMTSRDKPPTSQSIPGIRNADADGLNIYLTAGDGVAGFNLQKQTVQYKNGVLVFEMRNAAGKTLAFTEQRLPINYNHTSLRSDKDFTTPYGKAYITDGVARTTGALFTNDQTWILINAPEPIGGETMQQILQSLQPVKL